jgi:hypothetical protein
MASIGFCPLAKPGVNRHEGWSQGRGSPSLHGAQRRKGGETPATTKRSAARAQTAWPLPGRGGRPLDLEKEIWPHWRPQLRARIVLSMGRNRSVGSVGTQWR